MEKHKLSNEELSAFCLEMSLLLHAGVGIGDGLALIAQQSTPTSGEGLYSNLAQRVDDGASLAQALRDTNRFPLYMCGLMDVGEHAGRTEEALSALAAYYEGRARMDHHLRSALLYPAVLFLIMLGVIVVLLARVLPIFDSVYAQLGGSLTGLAGGLLSLGRTLDGLMPVVCVVLGVAVLFLVAFSALPVVRDYVLTLWRKHWGDGGLSRMLTEARFAQALSMGLNSGLPLEESLSLAGSLLQDVPAAQKRCAECTQLLQTGAPLAKAMGDSRVLPATDCRLLGLGIQGGSGDKAMEQIAKRLSTQSESGLEERVAQVELLLVVVGSVLVGVILLAVMLPLMHIMTAIG